MEVLVGVCRQNIYYHAASFVISFNLICNMNMFKKVEFGPTTNLNPRVGVL